jgi:hypothetical protein
MSTILKSLHGLQLGLDKDGYVTSPVGAKFPSLHLGPSGSELDSLAITAATTASNISAGGLTTLGSSAGANPAYNIDAPVPGVRKVLASIGASTGQTVSSTGAGATFSSTTGVAGLLTFTGIGQTVELVGRSTSQYVIVGGRGTVAATS